MFDRLATRELRHPDHVHPLVVSHLNHQPSLNDGVYMTDFLTADLHDPALCLPLHTHNIKIKYISSIYVVPHLISVSSCEEHLDNNTHKIKNYSITDTSIFKNLQEDVYTQYSMKGQNKESSNSYLKSNSLCIQAVRINSEQQVCHLGVQGETNLHGTFCGESVLSQSSLPFGEKSVEHPCDYARHSDGGPLVPQPLHLPPPLLLPHLHHNLTYYIIIIASRYVKYKIQLFSSHESTMSYPSTRIANHLHDWR